MGGCFLVWKGDASGEVLKINTLQNSGIRVSNSGIRLPLVFSADGVVPIPPSMFNRLAGGGWFSKPLDST